MNPQDRKQLTELLVFTDGYKVTDVSEMDPCDMTVVEWEDIKWQAMVLMHQQVLDKLDKLEERLEGLEGLEASDYPPAARRGIDSPYERGMDNPHSSG